MFAVVSVHSKKVVDPAIFQNVQKTGRIEEAVAKSIYNGSPEVNEDFVHWQVNQTSVLLFAVDNENGFQVHVESHLDKSCISQLKRKSEDALQTLDDVAKTNKIKYDSKRIEIWAENNLIEVGKPQGFWKYLGVQFVDKLLSTFLTAFVGALVTLFFSSQNKTPSVVTFLAISLALIGRIVVEAINYRKRIVYNES